MSYASALLPIDNRDDDWYTAIKDGAYDDDPRPPLAGYTSARYNYLTARRSTPKTKDKT